MLVPCVTEPHTAVIIGTLTAPCYYSSVALTGSEAVSGLRFPRISFCLPLPRLLPRSLLPILPPNLRVSNAVESWSLIPSQP